MFVLSPLSTPLAAPLEAALTGMLQRVQHGWLAGADAPVAHASARRSRHTLAGGGVAAFAGERPLVAGRHTRADWDSTHFGLEIHRFDEIVEDRHAASPPALEAAAHALVDQLLASTAGAALTLARVPLDASSTVRALEARGFRTFGAQLTFSTSGPLLGPESPSLHLRRAVADDVPMLEALSAEAMAVVPTHLHANPTLMSDRVDALYAAWARNSVAGGLADHVVVAEIGGAIAGFATGRLVDRADAAEARLGTIPLVAVSAAHRGQGVGRAVVQRIVALLLAEGAQWVTVGTQANNVPATRLYVGLGFRPGQCAVNLHRMSAGGG